MLLHVVPDFLAKTTVNMPANVVVRAVGIHPSSEVDLVLVDGHVLSPGSIVPATHNSTLQPIRSLLNGDQLIGAEGPNYTPGDGEFEFIGGSLVLQLYEECDQLIPPGPRASFYKDVEIDDGDIPTTAEEAKLAMRVPFHGRRSAQLSFWRSNGTADLNVLIVGRSYGRRGRPLADRTLYYADEGSWTEAASETWWNGAVSAPTVSVEPTLLAWRTVDIDFEAFDELQIFIWGDAGGLARLTCEAYGERIL